MEEPISIGEIIPGSLKALGDDFYKNYLRNAIIVNWKEIVGEINANNFKPLYVKFRKLHVYCQNSSWKSVMHAYKSEFIRKINDYVQEDLVEDIVFSNNFRKDQIFSKKNAEIAEAVDMSEEIRKIVLTEAELEEIKQSCECVEDDDLRESIFKANVSHMKLDKYRRSHGWHDCLRCGIICSPKDKICEKCRRIMHEEFEEIVVDILHEIPWLSYAEMRREIEKVAPQMLEECTPENIETVKSKYIQYLCRSININDKNQVGLLVMLFKGVNSKDLNDNIIKNALYELRFDMPTNKYPIKVRSFLTSK